MNKINAIICLTIISLICISGCDNTQHTSQKIQVKPNCSQQDYDLGAKFIKNTGIGENAILGMVLSITNKPLNSTPKIRECIARDTYKKLNREKPIITKAIENIDACIQMKIYSKRYMQAYNNFYQKNPWLENKISQAYLNGIVDYIKNPLDKRLKERLPNDVRQSTDFLTVGGKPEKLIKIDFNKSLTPEQKNKLKALGDKLTMISAEDLKNSDFKNLSKNLEEIKNSQHKRTQQLLETFKGTLTNDLMKIFFAEQVKCHINS